MSISQRMRFGPQRGSIRMQMMASLSRILLEGGVMAYPTETVYGLGGLAFSEEPFNRICSLKHRTSKQPFIILIPSVDWLDRFSPPDGNVSLLSRRFWPGPLTLVLEALEGVPERLLGEDRTIALRHSSSSFVQRLMTELGQPLISTSANPAGLPPPLSPIEVIRYFEGHREVIDVLVEWPERMTGNASTMLSLTGGGMSVLREGPISTEDILDTLS